MVRICEGCDVKEDVMKRGMQSEGEMERKKARRKEDEKGRKEENESRSFYIIVLDY